MKIAYLFERFPSPTETFLSREVDALQKLGFEIEIWALQAGPGARSLPLPPRAWKLAGKSRFWQRAGRNWARELRERQIEHVHATWANHIADLAQNAAHKAGLPWSFAAHARDLWVDGGDLGSKLQSAKFAATCTRAGEIELKKQGAKAIDAKATDAKVIYAPHGLPLDNYPFRLWQPETAMRLLGVGRLISKKGWPDLLTAAAQLKAHGANFSVQLVGAGPLQTELEKQILALQLENEVELLGALPQNEVLALMQRAHCLILPSRLAPDGDRDGLANVLLEAGALGLPMVTTDAGSAGDFVDETTGNLFDSGDSEALCREIALVFAQPQETQERCLRARKRVEEQFDIEKNALVLASAFEK